jgi:Flp pilus assembly protein TadD
MLSWLVRGAACLVLLGAGTGLSASERPLSRPGPEAIAYLAEQGIHVSAGAAAGYVADAVCADCHAEKAESFAEMGMARSFYRATPDTVIEDFDAMPFYHEPSDRYYEMTLRDGAYWFTRYRKDATGVIYDRFETEVPWIMGSGNHVRVYIFRTPDGTLFQLPIAWYTQTDRWAMAPGYEMPDHSGVTREVSDGCMACHNSYAELPAEAGHYGYDAHFPEDLPEGIGCQRCHGPGADHVHMALTGGSDMDSLRAAIVQPGKLENDTLYSVCYGCHMQPTVAVNAQYRLGRGAYSFRPGEDITDYLAHVDIVDPDMPKSERFEINHHPYRMEQSACFTQTEGLPGRDQLGCLTCHDPHVKIKPEERAAHYREACLSCHVLDEAGLPRLAGSKTVHPEIEAEADCTTCHMPERRTQDVVEVWMTDHRITRFAEPRAERLAPILSADSTVGQIHLVERAQEALDPVEAALLQLFTILEYTEHRSPLATSELARILNRATPEHYEPWLHLLNTYVVQGDYGRAQHVAQRVLELAPDNPTAISLAAVSFYATGRKSIGVEMLEQLVAERPNYVRARMNLARLYAADGAMKAAIAEVNEVVVLRPNHWKAWHFLARLSQAIGDNEAAIEAYLTALEVEPGATELRQNAARLLLAEGQAKVAHRHAADLTD